MKIAIDARMLEKNTGLTGVAIVLLETLRALNEIDEINEYYLISRKPIQCDIRFKKNWHLINKDFPQGMVWYNTILVYLLKKYDVQVFWNLNHILPLTKPRNCKYIVTIHDLALMKFEGIGEKSNIIKQRIFVKRSAKKADKIVAVSEATKKDIVELLNIDPEKVVVNYNGGATSNLIPGNVDFPQIAKKYSIPGEYFLFVGTLEPRKNLITLVKAFEQFLDSAKQDIYLVIAGGKGWEFQETQNYIDKSKWKNKILQIGYVTNEEKRVLLNNAICFVFPSLYEGFGIPVIEAFQEDTIVITSKVSSLPEVGGDAALYVDDPLDINSLSHMLEDVVIMDSTIKAGIHERIKMQQGVFSWDKTARKMMTVFNEME